MGYTLRWYWGMDSVKFMTTGVGCAKESVKYGWKPRIQINHKARWTIINVCKKEGVLSSQGLEWWNGYTECNEEQISMSSLYFTIVNINHAGK